MSSIEELKFDKKNFNKHTPHGMGLLEKSLRSYGAGRSILVDKDNNIIAGNGIVESAINVGITKTRIVETTGDELVVVRRKDVMLDSKQGREMALADNATSSADLEWDEDNLRDVFTEEELEAWDVELGEEGLFLSPEDLKDIDPLPSAYEKGEDVDTFEFGRAIEYDADYQELQKQVESCANPELKKLFERRLKDFSDFNFAYIADYYQSGASEEEKDLMEQLGLVIPCERKALELGFIDLEQSVILGGGTL